jgi:hypothetical protein
LTSLKELTFLRHVTTPGNNTVEFEFGDSLHTHIIIQKAKEELMDLFAAWVKNGGVPLELNFQWILFGAVDLPPWSADNEPYRHFDEAFTLSSGRV